MSYDEKKQLNESSPSKSKKWLDSTTLKKVKTVAGHVGLLVTLMIYTLIGGLVFRKLELPAEFDRLSGLKTTLLAKRLELLTSVNNTNLSDLAEWELTSLRPYELAVQEAARSGLSMDLIPLITATENEKLNGEPLFAERWSILQAVFFASTILTTIGYGNVYPSTFFGRVFCILYALIGIPLTLTVIADYGKIFATGVSSLAKKLRTKIPKNLNSCIPSNTTGKKSLGALAAVVLLFLYLAFGAALFMLWEKNWTFFEGFYFCFVTMTTIGFGDVVPTNTKFMLFCTGYILVGLALTSTIIELVRMQYADSWKRLQALSGPLADTLRKLGEQAGGDMTVLQGDLRKVLRSMSIISPYHRRKSEFVPSSRGSKDEDELQEAVRAILRDIVRSNNIQEEEEEEEEEEPEPEPEPEAQKPRKSIVQIIIYESSV